MRFGIPENQKIVRVYPKTRTLEKLQRFFTLITPLGGSFFHTFWEFAFFMRLPCNYWEHFKGKTIFCNCDDPYESYFFKYFALNFNHLGLKKLIATCYAGSPIANKELSLFEDESEENKTTKMPHKIEITEITDINQDGAVDLTDVQLLLSSDKNHLTRLKGDGDFRSQECVEIIKQADIVVTNPPFSLLLLN